MIKNFKADLIYGATGTGKTSNIGRAALWYYNKFGGRTRLISSDPGGFGAIEHLVDEGIIEPWVINQRSNPIESLDLACQGFWPVNMDDPSSKMVATPTTEWAKISLVAFEGLTSSGDLLLKRLRDTRAKLSQDPSYIFTEGTLTYAGSNMSYYGFVQDRLYEFVVKSHLLPCQRVLWTALEARGEDESRSPIYGPSIAGKKATGKAGQWFGNMLHLEMITQPKEIVIKVGGRDEKQTVVKSVPIMYLRRHISNDAAKIPFDAKTRAPFEFVADVPDFMDADLGAFYDLMESLKDKAKALRAKAPTVVTTTTK